MSLPTALASTALLLSALLPQDASQHHETRPVHHADPRPALAEVPVPPGMVQPRKGEGAAPFPGVLPRNGAQVARFTAQGQRTEYAFEASAGELSLFDFATWGYARSWHSTAQIQIVDPEGKPLLATQRSGETAYRKFLPFVAPRDGRYRLRLKALDEFFRYTLIRHSDYELAGDDPAPFAGRTEVHGFLATPDDTCRYTVELESGQEVALRVSNDHPMARRQKQNQRRRAQDEAAILVAGSEPPPERGSDRAAGARGATPRASATPRGGRAEAGEKPEGHDAPTLDFPDFLFAVSRQGTVVTEPSFFATFTPEHSGTYQIDVSASHVGEGGLFILELVRAPERVEISGYVGDSEDDPVPGIALTFFRQPDSDPIAHAQSDENGEFRLELLKGTYRVHYGPADGGPRETVPANIQRPREVNVVWDPPSRH